jgi:hypothetical protein
LHLDQTESEPKPDQRTTRLPVRRGKNCDASSKPESSRRWTGFAMFSIRSDFSGDPTTEHPGNEPPRLLYFDLSWLSRLDDGASGIYHSRFLL